MNKAQAGSWNVIVATIIGLVVLVTLIFIFSDNINLFSKTANSCEDKGGVCANSCGDNYAYTVLECPEEVPKCCMPQREVPDAVFDWAGDFS